ncbi:MAG: RnfABCDGE type electron transport complex subunit B [Candidatus Tantalella remota]|nr:RnfABCDGE type electron transport complex subunit B [Candidatus Tantalella remota]
MLASILSMTGLAILFAGILAFADKKLRVEEDPMIVEVLSLLPHVNCAACGQVSCHAFAEQIVQEHADPAGCRVMGEEAMEKLCALVGRGGGGQHPEIAVVHCAAEEENKKPIADYTGRQSCRSAELNFGGGMQCEYGCMGFGDCVAVCPFDAIHMEKRLPRVDVVKCVGCGKCAEACPRGIIRMTKQEHKNLFYVACSSRDNALRVRQVCGVGCIACGICEKLSPEKFFVVTDNLSRADLSKQDKQEEIETVAAKCPTKVIKKA